MSWDHIVNKGVSSWPVITSNTPNAGLSQLYCNAVPDVDDWATLSDNKMQHHTMPLLRTAKDPKTQAEIVTIDIECRIWWQYGNQYKGKGMFLKTIWTEVVKCDVKPGFDVSMAFRCSDPWNDSPDPNWPASMINLGVNAAISTKKWQKDITKWRYNLMYNGNLVIN